MTLRMRHDHTHCLHPMVPIPASAEQLRPLKRFNHFFSPFDKSRPSKTLAGQRTLEAIATLCCWHLSNRMMNYTFQPQMNTVATFSIFTMPQYCMHSTTITTNHDPKDYKVDTCVGGILPFGSRNFGLWSD